MNRGGKIALSLSGLAILGTGVWYFVFGDRRIKDIVPDALPQAPSSGRTGYRRIDAILGKLRSAATSAGIPLGLLVGWIAKESGGKLEDTTILRERGYFQLMPAESKSIGVDHDRLSTDSDYSIDAGIKLIQHYQAAVDALGVAPSGSSYYWKLVKLAHSMGGGQVKKVVTAAKAEGQAGSWNQLAQFAYGMTILGPQPKKWFPFVDLVYSIGYPFGFGFESSSVGGHLPPVGSVGLHLLGAEIF